MDFQQQCQNIELILSDVDGVLSDGRITYDNQGVETKQFHARDGLGIKLWQTAGYQFGLVTGRSSQIVRLRASELNISLVRQGVDDKIATVEQLLDELGLTLEQTAFIGDDLPDLPVISRVGLGIAVADASPELLHAANFVTIRPGGVGAVREAIEMILKNQGRWDAVIQMYRD